MFAIEPRSIPMRRTEICADLSSKRKISGGTVSRNGRQARDSMLSLMKTCQKLGLSF
ncbi:hypothetical protein [Rhizobium laguerreae]|uniref:hypothetical protein n=1 Tax=Rhizobium laguerreae TaxID=1076926 RepID=UPI001C90C433|nr:hypothetical protein [Rhizobium laguerreae]MBY3211781.1 hypothetical protein [Rhizobium laguerreae]